MQDNEIDTLIETLIDISGMYYECRAQLDGLATAVRAREKMNAPKHILIGD